MSKGWLVAVMLALGGCVATTTEPEAPAVILDPVDIAGLQEREPDTCRAADHQDLVGQPREAAEALALDRPVRIIAPGDIVSQEYVPNRINFRLDLEGNIYRVDCG